MIKKIIAGLILVTLLVISAYFAGHRYSNYDVHTTASYSNERKSTYVDYEGDRDLGLNLLSEEEYEKIPESTVPDFNQLSKEDQQSILDGCPWVAGHRAPGPCSNKKAAGDIEVVAPKKLIYSQTRPAILGSEIVANTHYLLFPDKTWKYYLIWQGDKGMIDSTGNMYYVEIDSIRLPSNQHEIEKQIAERFSAGKSYLIITEYLEDEGYYDTWKIADL